MPFFSQRKDTKVQSLVLKLVNVHCPDAAMRDQELRFDRRVSLVLVTAVLPLEKDKLLLDQAFTAVTKEFSNTGLSIVLDNPLALQQAILGFRVERDMVFFRAEAKHLNPMGGGFFQLGFKLLSTATLEEFPELAMVNL